MVSKYNVVAIGSDGTGFMVFKNAQIWDYGELKRSAEGMNYWKDLARLPSM